MHQKFYSVFFSTLQELAWIAALKITKLQPEFLTNIIELVMLKKGIRRLICNSIFLYAKANNKYMKENVSKKAKDSS